MRRALATLAAAMLASAVAAAPVPFVGCPSDGQQGPEAAPRQGKTPDLPAAAASRLAFYRSADDIAVLAPRGWHCFGLEGSNGSTLIVAPEPIDWRRATTGGGLTGPAVQLSYSFGETSGRFEVAEIAARAFPSAESFVRKVEAEGLVDHSFPRQPYPADRRTYRGRYQLLYTTAAGQKGLGTHSRLAPGPLPIDGVEWLHPESDMDLTSLAIRLPPDLRPLVAEIIRQATPPPAAKR